jgi:hypothetical protein
LSVITLSDLTVSGLLPGRCALNSPVPEWLKISQCAGEAFGSHAAMMLKPFGDSSFAQHSTDSGGSQ